MRNLAQRAKTAAKIGLKRAGQAIGVEVAFTSLRSRADLRLAHYLKLHDVDLVMDIGANRGQFANQLFNAGFGGRVVSFEPLPDAYDVLSERAAAFGDRWTVAPRVALSDSEGVAEFYVTETDTASSLLQPEDCLVAATPRTRPTARIKVPTARLDDYLREHRLMRGRMFLKLDVQGAESMVLAGAPQALTAASGVLAELSLTPLYEGQQLAKDVLAIITASGFEVWDLWDAYRHPHTYRLNQIDVVCFRRGGGTSASDFRE